MRSVRPIDCPPYELGEREACPNRLAGEERMLTVGQGHLGSPAHDAGVHLHHYAHCYGR